MNYIPSFQEYSFFIYNFLLQPRYLVRAFFLHKKFIYYEKEIWFFSIFYYSFHNC